MAMLEILSELKMLPDVHGGFFFHSKKGVLYEDIPASYKSPVLDDMGRRLTKLYATRRLYSPDGGDINLYFAESAVVSRAITEQFFLVLLCSRHVNSITLSVSLRLAIEEHADALDQVAAAQTPRSVPGQGARIPGSQQIQIGPLKQYLDQIRHTLVDLMGPMAELVYEESLEKWLASGRTGVDLLPEFIEIIADEIPDTGKATAFRDSCRKLV